MNDSTPTRPAAPPLTTARLSLGDPSPSISTQKHLRFQLDHALARDAVHTPLDTGLLLHGLQARSLPPLLLHSAAPDRKTYLRRPDLGRTLGPASIAMLQSITTSLGAPSVASDGWGANHPGPTLALILADGLSSLALEHHALPLLDALVPLLPSRLSPVTLVTNARVAIADRIGHLLGAEMTILLIGERPGLSSPDSLGCYLTWNPQPGKTTDAERNCISNIRGPEGLSYAEAAGRIVYYIAEAYRLQITGTALKDPSTHWLAKL